MTKSVTASNIQFDEWRTASWASALKEIRRLGGLRAFKSVLFKQAFERRHYPCEFAIFSLKGKLQGAMTFWLDERGAAPKIGPTWHIGDFDTAAGTSGVAHVMLSRFMATHGTTFYLWCWDDVSERFWRHMGRRYSLTVRKVGETPWGTSALLFSQARRACSRPSPTVVRKSVY